MARIKNKRRADGRLQSKIYLGVIDGKRKYKYVYARTQKELNQKVDEVKIKLGKGLDILAQRDTFGEWAERWLRLKKTEVSPHRYYVYECRVKNLSPIAEREIYRIRTMDIQDIIIDCADKYSVAVLVEIKSTAKQIFSYAIDNRVIDYNPAVSVRIPDNKANQTEKRRALTEQEQKWVVDTPHRARTSAMIMMYAGLRRGELVPLLWSDVDLEHGIIRVNKSIEREGSNWRVKQGAKSKAGVRNVYIPQILIDYLKNTERTNNMLVCPDSKGNMMSLSSWNSMWESYLAELNFRNGDFSHILNYDKPDSRFSPEKIPMVIPRITPHWLRHTFITSMYLAGMDVGTVKEQAGHADIKTTMAIYVHLDSIYKEKQIDKLNEYYGCQMGVSNTEKIRKTG
ncbi:MAG: site-specific integrase [Ruminococcus sp.]|nr:site-specific integrase [Ruminococcus sp.]